MNAMIDLQDSVASVLLDDVGADVEAEWKALWHNASITWPDIDDDAEWELFWECLGTDTRWLIENLQDEIHEQFGESLTLYQYGRSGATIAPHDWMHSSYCGGFGSYNDSRWEDDRDNDPVCALATARSDLAVLQLINKRVKAMAAGVAEWWAEVREDEIANRAEWMAA